MAKSQQIEKTPDHIKDLAKARNGDREAITRFLAWMDTDADMGPRFAEMLTCKANTALSSVARMLLGNDDPLILEIYQRRLQTQCDELAGANATPLERLVAERVVVSREQLDYFEGVYAQSMNNMTMRQGEDHQKRIDHAHRRYLAAIKALATVRRLQLPAMQVNIGEKQINVIQSAGGQAGVLAGAQPAVDTRNAALEAPPADSNNGKRRD